MTLSKTLRENTEQVAIATANKALQNCHSMLDYDPLPPHVPKEPQSNVNIYLFIALLSDILTSPFQCRNKSATECCTIM